MEQRDRHVDSDGPAGKVRQLRVTGKDGDEQLGDKHGQKPDEPGKDHTAGQQQTKGLLDPVPLVGPEVKADDGWAPWVSP